MAPWDASISCRHFPGPPLGIPRRALRLQAVSPPSAASRPSLMPTSCRAQGYSYLVVCGYSLDVCFLSFYFHEGCENNF